MVHDLKLPTKKHLLSEKKYIIEREHGNRSLCTITIHSHIAYAVLRTESINIYITKFNFKLYILAFILSRFGCG